MFVTSWARFSDCRRYRYLLQREWHEGRPTLVFIMLNPSTADENVNDPTVERCQRRAMRMGYGAVRVVNLFALRSTDPRGLRQVADPVGPENNAWIREACTHAGMVIAAWGVHGTYLSRADDVLRMLWGLGVEVHHLGLTEGGHPRHPLYVGYNIEPQRWGWAEAVR